MMEKVKLGDVFSLIRNGANIKQGMDDTGYPITRIETISDRTVNREKMGYAGITDVSKYDDYILQDGDILMSHINSEKHLGKTAIYKKQDKEKIIHGMNLLCLRPEKSVILPEYAFYFLSSVAFLRQIPNITKKSVNQASFTVTALKELSFAKCNIDEQKKIIDELDKVTGLIDIRKMQLSKLDELVKARFVELFGQDLHRHSVNNLADICTVFTDGDWIESKDQSEEGIRLVQTGNVGNGVFKNKEGKMRFVSETTFVELGCKEILPGDILISRLPDPVGRACVVPDGLGKMITAVDCSIVRLNGIIMPQFLVAYTMTEMYQTQIEAHVTGSTRKRISRKNLGDVLIPIPSMELQNEFAAFVEQTDKSKLEVQKSLEKLEFLKKALMQKYFG